MKKKLISLLLAIAMVLSLCVPTIAIGPEGNALPEADDGVITLDKDYGVEGTSEFDFNGDEITLNLNGHKLMGSVINAQKVTVQNGTSDTSACLLGAIGTYANDVSKYVADGYDARVPEDATEGSTHKTEVFNNEDPDNFEIEIKVEPLEDDHDDSNGTIVDVYAAEKVAVFVKVKGARYVNADMTLTWDTSLFKNATLNSDIFDGWKGYNAAGQQTTVRNDIVKFRFTNPHAKNNDPQKEYYENGELIGYFEFEAKYIDEEIVKAYQDNETDKDNYYENAAICASSYCTFTVKNETNPAKVIGSWRKSEQPGTEPLADSNLGVGVAHIILMDAMTGDVSAKTGLTYKGSTYPQNLLDTTYNNNTGFSALVGLNPPVGNDGNPSAKVATVVMTKADYYKADGVTPKENVTIVYGTAGTALTQANIQATGAGDYVVCYKISAPGYASVTGVKNVNIAKQKVDLVWLAPTGFDSSSVEGINYEGEYSSTEFSAPTATYTSLDGNAIVTLNGDNGKILTISGPNGATLKDVGVYEFKADDDPNYEFNNPTCNVKVNGRTITGWTLKATNYEHTGNGTDVKNGVIWRDGEQYPIGDLDVAADASFKLGDGKYHVKGNTTDAYDSKDAAMAAVTAYKNDGDEKYYLTNNYSGEGYNSEEAAKEAAVFQADSNKYYTPAGEEVTNVNVVYEYSKGERYEADGDNHHAGDEKWYPMNGINDTNAKFADLGKYSLRMTVTADNYEKMSQVVNFEIKNPNFVIENLEYVAGYSIVLVYTNETGVSFKYGTDQMYDVTSFGYKYNNNNYGNGSTPYAKVFELVVKGVADNSLVYASNAQANQLSLPSGYTNKMPDGQGYIGNEYVNDVNNTERISGKSLVDMDDMTFIQSVYNTNSGNMAKTNMQKIIRSDVNRDKIVDNKDVNQSLAYYLNPTT